MERRADIFVIIVEFEMATKNSDIACIAVSLFFVLLVADLKTNVLKLSRI